VKPTQLPDSRSVQASDAPTSVRLATVAVFSALIAFGTSVLSIHLPPPLYEITLAPAFYLALSALSDRWTAFTATAVGGFIGEAYNVAFFGGGSPIYPFGMIWARAPEALIVAWAAKKGTKWLVVSMVIATVYETVAFYVPDAFFYAYGLFQYGSPAGLTGGFLAAWTDVFTLLDLAFIPVALGIIYAARPAFRRLGFR